ncbi:MAG: nucleotidyltransferase domain-containing protein [Bdellovibrionales bacterium]|nr:nucleotidyltransferase domain-containing protein [Bdellovibrionales bacterium]
MARVRKTKPTLDGLLFVTPEQKLVRLLLSEPTTSFTSRVLSSRLKGVRGLGGADGIQKILQTLSELNFIHFSNNNREISLNNDIEIVSILKGISAVCDLEGLTELLAPVTVKGVLFGSRSTGMSRSDSDYDLFVVTENEAQARDIAERHPLGKRIELVTWTPDAYLRLEDDDPALSAKLEKGIVLWGSTW